MSFWWMDIRKQQFRPETFNASNSGCDKISTDNNLRVLNKKKKKKRKKKKKQNLKIFLHLRIFIYNYRTCKFSSLQ